MWSLNCFPLTGRVTSIRASTHPWICASIHSYIIHLYIAERPCCTLFYFIHSTLRTNTYLRIPEHKDHHSCKIAQQDSIMYCKNETWKRGHERTTLAFFIPVLGMYVRVFSLDYIEYITCRYYILSISCHYSPLLVPENTQTDPSLSKKQIAWQTQAAPEET